jgi:hypothetical protein
MSRDGKVAGAVASIAVRLGDRSIESLYRERVRSLRTRSYSLNAPTRPTAIEIQQTLLGTELKIGQRRLLCPDIATARFLAVFAAMGVQEVAVPYDITQVKRLAEVLEAALVEQAATIEKETEGMTPQARGRVRSAWMASQRSAIVETGAGPLMPQFDQSTRQRQRR